MASPATTTAFQSTTAGSSIPSPNFTSEEANSKPTYSSKLGNTKGRQLENSGTATGSSRQTPSSKAWGPGTSPLTQRALNHNQRNGTSSQTQSVPAGSTTALLREGLRLKITLDSGAEFEGTYSCGNELTYTLKMVQQRKFPNSGDMPNGNVKTSREQSSMSFQKRDIADVHVMGTALPNRSARVQNGTSAAFRTDSAISGNRFEGERTLKPWVPDANVETDLLLESSRNATAPGAGWDQFEANNRLFGLTTDYDEDIYTTKIDKSHPDYSKRIVEAERKAQEIQNSITNNSHIAEERIVDNVAVDESGLDEEDKYSGVQRQEFPPLAPSGRPNKYTPPGRRPNATQLSPSGSLIDPAIISSSVARKQSPAAEKGKASPLQTSDVPPATQPEIKVSPKMTESKPAATPETKTPASASRTVSPHVRTSGTPNATATVERDVVSAFKGFAAQQRVQADKLRMNKAKADKEVKLHELKRFAANFKLNSPVPSDLVSIIAKDPAKQREIQEKAKRDAEEQAEKAKQAKLSSAEPVSSASSIPDPKAAQRTTPLPPHAGISSSSASSRPNQGRTGYPPQGPYASQSFRGDRPAQTQPIPTQNGRPTQGLGARLRSLEQSKSTQIQPQMLPHEARHPPTGPSGTGDANFPRRSSGAISLMGAKLNPNSNEFRPSPFAATFNPNSNRSSGSSPRSNSTSAPGQLVLVPAATLIRRKLVQTSGKTTNNTTESYSNIIESLAAVKPPPTLEKKWEGNGGVKPAFDTLPTWRQIADKEPAESSMHLTYTKLFENPPYPSQTMSPPQPQHVHPQVAHHHHQLPFHLQGAPHNLSQRQSPRQPQIHLHNQHNPGPNTLFNPPDEHRMMPSHSAQSFASPRLHPANMAYPSPMGQPAQLAYNQPVIQYPMGPGAPQIAQYRSYSGGHQYVPQQATQMGGPVMIPAPAGNGFIGPAGMVSTAPQMMYPGGQPHFMPQGNGPPPMPGSNGYPSPGRTAPMMMQQGSQPGQSVYGMSPGMQYGQPLYAQQQPSQIPTMRTYPPQIQPYGSSPQMHQYGPPHRGTPSNSYNKNYIQQHGPHPPAPQNQIPNGPQGRPLDGGDEPK